MAKQVLVNNKTSRLTVLKAKGGVKVRLSPGINTIDKLTWDKLKKLPFVENLKKQEFLTAELVEDAAEIEEDDELE